MQVSSLLNDNEIKELQQKFYEYFETGYAFEEFLKDYLLKMGLDEVEVTQRSRDGGIDLTAIRKGVGDFSEIDITHYYIQAKRYAYDNSVGAPAVEQLRGRVPDGHKGMLITTSKFSLPAQKTAIQSNLRPIILIDGKTLVTSCIDNEIGFIFKPVFSPKQMDKFISKKDETVKNDAKIYDSVKDTRNYIEKTLTFNDIRARIISVPSSIIRQFTDDMDKVDVIVNEKSNYNFSIVRGRNYFGGVTEMLKQYGAVSDDGVITARQTRWYYDNDKKIVHIYVEE